MDDGLRLVIGMMQAFRPSLYLPIYGEGDRPAKL